MSIIKYLKNLFNKENNAYLINGYVSFAIPKRDVLNEKQIEILTTTKEEYLGLLKNNIFTSLDLEIDDINEKREMYTKLLLNNMMSETKNNKVLSIKLKNYESDLINLRETLLIRLIALSEIVNQNRFKRITRDAIINEIGKIQLSLVTIDSQIVSIHNEIEAYLSNPQIGLDLDKRICDLEKLSEDIVKKCELCSKEVYIAYLERSLEIYCYKNKEEVSSLKDELDSLRCSEIDDNNINLLKERINRLEKMYEIYYEFDRNTIIKEDMYSLYEAKFYIHAYDYSFTNYNDLEKEVYLDIISKKINTLLNGNSPYILNLIENEDKDKAIKFNIYGDIYVMPEGIVCGTINSTLYDKLKKYKTIIVPKSLKSIEFEVDNSSTPNYCDLVLQEGTECLMFDYPDFSYYSTKFGNITIPSTLNKIDKNCSRYADNLIFEDYKNSEILKCDDPDLKQDNANALFRINSFSEHHFTVVPIYKHLILKDGDNCSYDLTPKTKIKVPEKFRLSRIKNVHFYNTFDHETATLFWDEFHKQYNMGKHKKKGKVKWKK